MLQNFFAVISRMYNFLISLIVAVILGVSTWVSWQYYQESVLQSEFVKEGKLVSVRVSEADHTQRSWRDILANSAYLTITYAGKTYTSRYVMDSTYVGNGDRVAMLYHAGYDKLRQPDSEVKFDRSTRTSRLIDWTSIRDFTNLHRLLFLCLLLTTASFFFISGVIVSVIPISLLSNMARLLFVFVLLLGGVFFSYDVWAYIRYYNHLKHEGKEVKVRVVNTDRISQGRSSKAHWYDYRATIVHQQKERVIPISEDDFTALKPGDNLSALYDSSVDDYMSSDFVADYWKVVVPLFFFLLCYLFGRPTFNRRPASF
ncbi:hypothetical protein [Spirosoma aerophilum]